MIEPFSSNHQTAQGGSEKVDLVVYVEELAGEGDYWLSITDAARICRVQDVSIRRAIAKGNLSVRRKRAGQNKRTRFVRASDLPRAGFPIIDESAAITTEIGKVDILSIPRQQQQIVQDHRQLLSELANLRTGNATEHTEIRADLQQQQAAWQIALQTAQQAQTQQHTLLETRLVQEQTQLQQTLTETEQRLSQTLQTLCQDVAHLQTETRQHAEGFHKLLRAQQTALEVAQQEHQRALTAFAAQQQQQIDAYQARVQAQFQQLEQTAREHALSIETQVQGIEQAANEHLAACEQRMTASLAEQTRQFEARLVILNAQLAAAQSKVEQLEQHLSERDQAIARELQSQQRQLGQHAQLLPLLPYAQQSLLTTQDEQRWTQALAEMEARLLAVQRQEQARVQPLLALFTPERLEALARLLADDDAKK